MLGSRVELLSLDFREELSGEAVAYVSENPDRSAQAVAYPLSALKPRTAYVYAAKLRVDGQQMEKRARFETGD
jgi:hypothetical protein